jgi:RNA polymerase sigma-70 factor (ECF subfamily)
VTACLDRTATRGPEGVAPPPFSEIFAQHAPFVARSLRNLGVAEADLDDVCQEAFLVVHRRLGGFEGRSSLRTWIYGVAFRVAADYRKSAYVRRRQGAESGHDLAAPSDLGRSEARQLLRRVFAKLDPDKRQVLLLHEIEGFSIPEVAAMIGCPVQTAYTRLRAGRLLLARLLHRTLPARRPRRPRWAAC